MADRQESVRFRYSGWRVSVHENGAEPNGPDWQREFSSLLSKMENPDIILKHDHRAEVGTFNIGDVRYVIKKFTQQNTRLWFRLTSVFFSALGEIACRNALEMDADGIYTTRPVLLMQQIHNRMVTSSWLVYRFIDGQFLTRDNAQDIVAFVKNMHHAGWVHRDPHPGNFIRTSNGIATIDPIKARHSRSRYLRAYDVVLMEHDIPSAPDIYGRENLGIWFFTAKIGHTLLKLYRALKYLLRRPFRTGSFLKPGE